MAGEQPAEESDSSSGGRGGVVTPYEDEEVLAVLKARDDLAEPMTARQIADRNGRSRSATYTKCMKLVEVGAIRSKKTGARGRVFWIPLHAGLFERGESRQ